MHKALYLSGSADEGDLAAIWAREEARAARMGKRAADAYAERIRHGYEAACKALLANASDHLVMRISISKDSTLTPRFDMVDSAKETANITPRARRSLILRSAAKARAAARAAAHSA